MRLPLILSLLFFVSGLSGLVLETVWTRLMIRVFGSTTFAVSTVLTTFMAGLAGGSFLAGRLAARFRRARSAIAAYGALELIIGLYALAIPALCEVLPRVHGALWGFDGSSYRWFGVLRFLLVAIVLAVPALAMGATLPVLTRALGDNPTDSGGRLIGGLYAVNTAGAVVGVFLAGFVLLPCFGTRATNGLACLADVGLGMAAFGLWRLTKKAGHGRAADADAAGTASGAAASGGRVAGSEGWLGPVALASIAVSGAIAMSYEVAWTRALTLILGSSVYAFSLILLCFLVGLAAGAAAYARRQARDPDQAGNLALAHLLAAAGAAVGIALMDHLPAMLLAGMQLWGLTANTAFVLKLALAASVMVLPTFFMGMVFPAVIQIWAVARAGRNRTTGIDAARAAGDVYASNTVGSIVGAFGAGFVLIPSLGVQTTLRGLVAGGILLAATFAWMSTSRRRLVLFAACLTCLPIPFWLSNWNQRAMNAGVFRVSRYGELLDSRVRLRPGAAAATQDGQGRREDPRLEAARGLIPLASAIDCAIEPEVGYRIREVREGVTTSVAIGRSVSRSLAAGGCWAHDVLLVNGKPDASLSVLHRRPKRGCKALLSAPLGRPGAKVSAGGDAETQVLSGLLPICVHGKKPRKGLIIGWGSGVTVGATLASGLEKVVAVELEREVVAAARAFEPYNGTPQKDSRLEIVEADGRNYLALAKTRFDIVISEPSNPWMAGCSSLFTREFFEQVRAKLAPDGVFLQWLQAYEIAPSNVFSVLSTLSSVFDDVHVFSPHEAPTDLLLVAKKRRAPLRWADLAACTRGPTGRVLARVGIRGPADVLARLRALPAGVRQLARGAALNTDDNSRLEFAAPRDLINYRTYRPSRILEQLEATRPPGISAQQGRSGPGESGAIGSPENVMSLLCEAYLSAGKLSRARRLIRSNRLVRCKRLLDLIDVPATKLAWPFAETPPVDKFDALRRANRLRKSTIAFSARRAPRSYLKLAYLEVLADRPYKALVFSLASLSLGPARGRGPAHHLLAALLTDIWKHREAVGHATSIVDEKLSTAVPPESGQLQKQLPK